MTDGLYTAVLISCCFQYLIKGQIVDIATPDSNTYTFLSRHGYGIGAATSLVFSVRPNSCKTAYVLLAESTTRSGYFRTVMIYTNKIDVHNFKTGLRTTFNSPDTLLVCGQFTPFKILWTAISVTTYRMESNNWIEVYTYSNADHGVVTEVGIKTVGETGDWKFGEELTTTTATPSTTESTTPVLQEVISTTEKHTTTVPTGKIPTTVSTGKVSRTVSTGKGLTTASIETSSKTTTIEEISTQLSTMTSHNTPQTATTGEPATSLTHDDVTSTTPLGLCKCNCSVQTETASLESLIAALRKELIVSKKETSLFKRSLISAPDDRTSSKSIGYVGVVFLACVFGGIIALDFKYIVIIFQNSIRMIRNSGRRSSKVSTSSEATLKPRKDSWISTD